MPLNNPLDVIDKINKQPTLDVPKKPDKSWSSFFIYLVIVYSIFTTYKLFVQDRVSRVDYNNLKSINERLQAENNEYKYTLLPQLLKTKRQINELSNIVDSVTTQQEFEQNKLKNIKNKIHEAIKK